MVALVPPACQYPEIACCRVLFDEEEYISTPFAASEWELASDILVEEKCRGHLTVFYSEGRPTQFKGPFLEEERHLLDAVARALGEAIERHRVEEERVRLIEAIKQSEEMVFVADPQGKIQYANPAFERTTGYTVEEIRGRNVSFFFDDEAKGASSGQIGEMLEREKGWRGVFVIV